MSAAVDEAGITRDWQQAFMLDTSQRTTGGPGFSSDADEAKRHWKSLAEARKQIQRCSYQDRTYESDAAAYRTAVYMTGERIKVPSEGMEGITVATNPGAGTGFMEKLLNEARGLKVPYKKADLIDDMAYEIFHMMERVAQGQPMQSDVELLPVLGIKMLAPKLDHYTI
ncbi:unnamed protein product [Cladocopium goreaui]|uniref:Uncharacterized protein n=1 Tax=Cladocopium goreaui TaxID=2562237 RepID=A0A9P1GE98_9DINO|nr:unnamed protein product [Cladocopium goreaui]